MSARARLEVDLRLPLAHFELAASFASDARCLGVFGPSGSGKTSLLEAVAGWRAGATGRVRVGETVFFDTHSRVLLPMRRRGVGYVPQDALLFPHLSVRENLAAHARPAGTTAELGPRLLERTLATLDLEPLLERRATTLSGGERQRVALGRALCSQPRLLFFDEPLGSLDLALRRRILPYLVRLRDAFDVPMWFVSHDPTEVQALCDEVLVLESGKLRAQGEPSATLRTVLPAGLHFENVLHGVVGGVEGGTALLVCGGVELRVPGAGLNVGERASIALSSDDVLLALHAPTGLSARNVLPAHIEDVRAGGDDALVELALGPGVRLSATVTQGALRQLALGPGSHAFAVFKSSSCRVLTRPS